MEAAAQAFFFGPFMDKVLLSVSCSPNFLVNLIPLREIFISPMSLCRQSFLRKYDKAYLANPHAFQERGLASGNELLANFLDAEYFKQFRPGRLQAQLFLHGLEYTAYELTSGSSNVAYHHPHFTS